ncbi:hypothetical protein BST81_04160 [Leptolyngbya sp. 'hensonii']|nr:hypothetical protein BST81_04160 [Leptolyngbya sp. 'hensonii']
MEQAESFLKELPKKETEYLPIVEAIHQIAPSIRAALAKGYTYTEVAALLSGKLSVSVSSWSLRRYVPLGLRRSKSSERNGITPRRQRRQKQKPLSESDRSTLMMPGLAESPASSGREELTAAPVTPEPMELEIKPEESFNQGRGRTVASKTSAKTTRNRTTGRTTGTRRTQGQ